jgi:hypothetical protein
MNCTHEVYLDNIPPFSKEEAIETIWAWCLFFGSFLYYLGNLLFRDWVLQM